MTSAMIILSCLFASRFPCAVASRLRISLGVDGVLLSLLCLAAVHGTVDVVVDAFEMYMVRFGLGLAMPSHLFLPCSFCTFGVGFGVLSSMSQLV
jgi:hypothetical protein